VREAAARKALQQRKRDEKEAKECGGDSFFRQTNGRKNLFKRKR
jgi:hypothetical protein